MFPPHPNANNPRRTALKSIQNRDLILSQHFAHYPPERGSPGLNFPVLIKLNSAILTNKKRIRIRINQRLFFKEREAERVS